MRKKEVVERDVERDREREGNRMGEGDTHRERERIYMYNIYREKKREIEIS